MLCRLLLYYLYCNGSSLPENAHNSPIQKHFCKIRLTSACVAVARGVYIAKSSKNVLSADSCFVDVGTPKGVDLFARQWCAGISLEKLAAQISNAVPKILDVVWPSCFSLAGKQAEVAELHSNYQLQTLAVPVLLQEENDLVDFKIEEVAQMRCGSETERRNSSDKHGPETTCMREEWNQRRSGLEKSISEMLRKSWPREPVRQRRLGSGKLSEKK